MPRSPGFQSERLVLRAIEPEDIPTLHTYLNHPDLNGRRYLPGHFPEDLPLSKKQVEKAYERLSQEEDGFHLAVTLRESQKMIGHASCDWGWDPYCPGVSLVISPSRHRQGYGSEVLEILLGYLFDRTLAHNVSMWLADWNNAGRDFAKKNGFQEIGRWRRAGKLNGVFFDTIVVDLLRPEWVKRSEAI